MQVKLFVSDLDGTLLKIGDQYSAGVSEENKQAIREFVKQGNVFAVATARGIDYKEELEKVLGFEIDYVGNNGALIKIQNRQRKHIIPNKLVKKVQEIVRDEKLNVTVTLNADEGFFYVPTNCYPFDDQNSNHNGDFLEKFAERYKEGPNYHVTKIMALANPKEIENIKTVLKQYLKDELEIVLSDVDLIDMTLKGCSKGNGVKELAEMYNIPDHRVGVVGDTENDASMFYNFKNSYCMDHATDEVKSAATTIVTSVKEALEQFMEIEN
ncbi:MAG: HAD-IIB family hydrolase [Anaerorhabdus sp.]|uniref:HAD-IIB family hydrolase n=1 Tax=Anaerorhabdus sp. TaxID=1872524 RepID=UPI002FCB8B5A